MYCKNQEEQKQAQKGDSKKHAEEEDIDWHDFVIVEQIDLYEDETQGASERDNESEK